MWRCQKTLRIWNFTAEGKSTPPAWKAPSPVVVVWFVEWVAGVRSWALLEVVPVPGVWCKGKRSAGRRRVWEFRALHESPTLATCLYSMFTPTTDTGVVEAVWRDRRGCKWICLLSLQSGDLLGRLFLFFEGHFIKVSIITFSNPTNRNDFFARYPTFKYNSKLKNYYNWLIIFLTNVFFQSSSPPMTHS